MFYADLHIHSKYSRATSRDADLEHLAIWACKKGVSVLGTGDFTHPAWFDELREKLVPAEPGLFRLRENLQRDVDQLVPGACQGLTRFMLQVEISTIYKKGDRTRKVHHLIYAPGFEQAARLIEQLSKIGNLKSDGRPILGLDSRHLLEIALESGEGCYLVPAHIWTPWFAALGSKSGFDSIDDCYGDLSHEIFALETGLSSDPPMNWRLSQLDRFRLVSNSDAHSPPKIGREACVFHTAVDYFAIRRALETGDGYGGTVEFFPEEGKYHLDGHRKCGICLSPEETRRSDGRCPACGKGLTVGVMNRVDSLADRPEGYRPETAADFRSFVPLPEVLAEIRGVGEKSKKVQQAYEDLVSRVGPELFILEQAPPEDLRKAGTPLAAEAIARMRAGDVHRQAGYDGEYGVIRLFAEGELSHGASGGLLFELARESVPAEPVAVAAEPQLRYETPTAASTHPADPPTPVTATTAPANRILDQLDPDQRTAAEHERGPLLIIAGPGTGKTRTLTHRIAHLIVEREVDPRQCLAITFTRRAAGELSERLEQLLPESYATAPVHTFHSLGLTILRENAALAGVSPSFRVADDRERISLLQQHAELSETQASRTIRKLSQAKRNVTPEPDDADLAKLMRQYEQLLTERELLDFDDLIVKTVALFEALPGLAGAYRQRWPWVFVDEYQDVDDGQYRLVRQLTTPESDLCVIGDPDQSIYGFRGANPQVFLQFTVDYPTATTVQLTRNYRSSQTIVEAALAAIEPSSLVSDRTLQALSEDRELIRIEACATERAEAEFVVHSIERLIGGSTFFSLDSGRVDHGDGDCLSFNDLAVLYRTAAQSVALEEAFQRSGMPYQKRSHVRLTDEPAVATMVQWMHQQTSSAPAASDTVCELLKRAADVVWDSQPEAADAMHRLYPIAERFGDDTPGFLAELALGVDADLWDPRADRVSLLTLHAAKGLEFPVVFLVGCEDGLLPLRWQADEDADNLAEERRLFFVGMTRAKRRLILSHAKERSWRGKLREMALSPFVQPIQEDLLERAQRSARTKRKRSAEQQMQLF